jgi:adenylylsulfate kinase
MSFAVWLTGLPGCGKSTIAREVEQILKQRKIEYSVLESDVLRTQITPFARYDEAERDFFYSVLCELGTSLVERGRAVIFDATANRRRYRDAARGAIDRFLEVHVDTSLETCVARDPKGLYRGTQAGLPGLQAPYEPPLAAELAVSGARGTPREAAERIGAELERRGWLRAASRP